jgi:hypothetical protein
VKFLKKSAKSMKNKSKFLLAVMTCVIVLASCTSKPAETTAPEQDSVKTDTTAIEPATSDTTQITPQDSVTGN